MWHHALFQEPEGFGFRVSLREFCNAGGFSAANWSSAPRWRCMSVHLFFSFLRANSIVFLLRSLGDCERFQGR